ncbi:NUDIX hydrolase [Sphaerochaeta globosa]|uniref:GDP-mannose pyrophosphatase n=1 Tax=Sphaerochaeta globosa (strain ATCC BAA-1886 / DSM 22777 / Buddy) TaxID=158189 RepID=F0RUN5_SPHGB|nr:NUDIX hydrolase [Sphaerochaeta globosa]ADY12397.1 NUDIX hydrolase [Sphaerochaeta globosa str. Buddy]
MFDPFTHDEQKETSQLMWKSGKRELVFKGPIFDICTVQRTSNDGRCSTFIEVDCQKWVTIVPWFRNADGVPMFVMVDQFRHGSATVTREFPAGVVEKGEDPMDAGLRELKEETGLEGERVTALGNVSPNSAFMNNRSYFYLVEDVKHTSGQELDPNEQLEVLSVPVQTVIELMGTGIYDNGIMMIALGYFLREANKRPELVTSTSKE